MHGLVIGFHFNLLPAPFAWHCLIYEYLPKELQDKCFQVNENRRLKSMYKNSKGAWRMSEILVGIIGGSGLYNMDDLENVQENHIETPFGTPSDAIITGTIGPNKVAFLARHSRNHSILPHEVNYRANIYAMKKLGVKYLLSFSAVGSLRQEIKPLDMVLPDQYIDFTKSRISSFFGEGVVAHASMADPICPELSGVFAKALRKCFTTDELELHTGGTYICMEGPQFSTRAESLFYRQIGANLIGMTNMPEAKLAREAQIAYASLCMVTDYDCWHPHEENVSADLAIQNLMQNSARAKVIAKAAIELIYQNMPNSIAHNALSNALITAPESLSAEQKEKLGVILA